MKRIFTPFAVLCMLAATQNASAQCSTGVSFTATTTNRFVSGTESFSGDFAHDAQGQNQYLRSTNVGSGIQKTLNSASFILAANQTNVSFGFDLSGNANVTSYAFTLVDASNSSLYFPICSGGALSNGAKTFRGTFPVQLFGKSFKIKAVFTLSGSQLQTIVVDDFITSASASQITLPVNFTGIEARKISSGTQVSWNVAQEEGVVSYFVEKSTDGSSFSKVGAVPATGSASYVFVDNQPSSSTAYYRVKSNDKDGQFKYSTTVKIDGSKASFVRNVYPMPASTEVFIQHNAAPSGTTLLLTAQDGRLVQRLQVQNGSLQTRIDLSSLKPGLYMVRFDNESLNTDPLKIIKQ